MESKDCGLALYSTSDTLGKKQTNHNQSLMKHIFTLFLCLTSLITMNAQSVSLFNIDASGFPTVKAKFFAFDAANKQQRPSKSELTITENGQPRTITSVTCPPDTIKSLSVCIMVDTYGYGLIKLAQAGTQRLINYLLPPKDEIAITIMNQGVQIHQDFTSDTAKATASVNSIPGASGVDVQSMFYSPYTGGVPFISGRKSDKKILILVSDLHCPKLTLDEARFYQDAAKKNISVYAVLLGTTDYSGLFNRVAAKTGGKVFEMVRTEAQITNIFQEIEHIEHHIPCEINWTNEAACLAGKKNVELSWQSSKSFADYSPPVIAIANLQVEPAIIAFGKRLPTTTNDRTITLTSQNADFTITGIIRKYGSADFKVVNTTFPLSIPKNTSKTITLQFAPSDSSLNYASFEILTDKCPGAFSAYGGFKIKKTSASTLKLTKPNGGEVFTVGSDTLITWEGIAPTDTVSLEFSADNGETWKLLTTKATGLKYSWQNVPMPPSAKCLVRVKQEGKEPIGTSPTIEWQRSLGGSGYDAAFSIQQSTDSGYIVAGYSTSNDGDVTTNQGIYDYWVVKLSQLGAIEWQKSLGGGGSDKARSIQQCTDGGYILAGYSQSNNGDVSGNHGDYDYWVVKLSPVGALEWQIPLGGSKEDWAQSIQQCTDGGYIVAGFSGSKDGDVSGNHGDTDFWVVKLSPLSTIEWQTSLGGDWGEAAYSIQQSTDGGYIVAGYSQINNGDVTGNHGNKDNWIVKLSPLGALEWQKSLGGSGIDYAQSIQLSADGGYIVAGYSQSNNGDLTDNHGGFYDYWIVKLSSLGTIEWQKSLGGSGIDYGQSIQQSADGGYIVAGYSSSNDGDVTGNQGMNDFWVVKLSHLGDIEWQKSLGGSEDEQANSIQQSRDGGYIVAGYSRSKDGDVTRNQGFEDFWVVKLSSDEVALQADTSDAVFSIIAPEPTLQNLSIDMGKVLVGQSKDSTVLGIICNKGSAPLHVLGIDITSGDSTDFTIPRGAGDFFLDSNECRDVMFGFAPTKVGARRAKATIRTTVGDFIDTISIIGEGIAPALAIVNPFIDFGKTLVGTPKDSTKVVTIKNVGTSDLTITQTDYNAVNTTNFSTITGGNSFTLQPNMEAIMDLRFLPFDVGRRSGILQFHYNGVGSPATVQLFGEGIINIPDTARTTVIAQNITAQAGEKVNLSLKLFKPTRMDIVGAPTDWYARINYNKSILFNEQTSNVCPGTTDSCVLELTGVYNPKSDELISLPCIATLGNTDHSPIVIDTFYWTNSAIVTDVATQNGTITITGVCEDGGARLFIPSKNSTSLATRPNPAQDKLQIQYGLREPLTVTLELLTMTGQVVQTIVNNQAQAAGQYTLTNDLHLLGNGVYLLRLRTNKELLTTRVDVVK
ncbi:MAG: choice-of-anchor D domain-containing protein [Candidatus Kapaibacterium sp.]